MLEHLPEQSSGFDTQSLQFATMNELKKSMSGDLQLFTLYLVVPESAYFPLKFEAASHNAMFVGRWSKYICP